MQSMLITAEIEVMFLRDSVRITVAEMLMIFRKNISIQYIHFTHDKINTCNCKLILN
jgi:hypothetical protein